MEVKVCSSMRRLQMTFLGFGGSYCCDHTLEKVKDLPCYRYGYTAAPTAQDDFALTTHSLQMLTKQPHCLGFVIKTGSLSNTACSRMLYADQVGPQISEIHLSSSHHTPSALIKGMGHLTWFPVESSKQTRVTWKFIFLITSVPETGIDVVNSVRWCFNKLFNVYKYDLCLLVRNQASLHSKFVNEIIQSRPQSLSLFFQNKVSL